MYLNLICIIFFLFYSIKIRANLVQMKWEIDKDMITASDFAVLAYNLNDELTEFELKQYIEKEFKLNVAYINYTYDVEEFVKAMQRQTVETKKKAIWNNF